MSACGLPRFRRRHCLNIAAPDDDAFYGRRASLNCTKCPYPVGWSFQAWLNYGSAMQRVIVVVAWALMRWRPTYKTVGSPLRWASSRSAICDYLMHTESEIVCNPTLRRRWDLPYLLGLAPPPLPESPEMAWYHYVLNGHFCYARLVDKASVLHQIYKNLRRTPNRRQSLGPVSDVQRPAQDTKSSTKP